MRLPSTKDSLAALLREWDRNPTEMEKRSVGYLRHGAPLSRVRVGDVVELDEAQKQVVQSVNDYRCVAVTGLPGTGKVCVEQLQSLDLLRLGLHTLVTSLITRPDRTPIPNNVHRCTC